MARDFLSRCTSCGGDIAWIRTRAREGKPSRPIPVQIMRKDGTGVHPEDVFAQGTHIPHWSVCPYADRHRTQKIDRIVEAAAAQRPPGSLAPAAPPPVGPRRPPPAGELSDETLRAGIDHYRGLAAPKDAQRARLAELEAELERRQIEAGKKILTMGPEYPWGDT